jgi:hypothetical protein
MDKHTYLVYDEGSGVISNFVSIYPFKCSLEDIIKEYIEKNYCDWDSPESAKGWYSIKKEGTDDPWVFVECPDVDYDPCFYTAIVKEEKIPDYNKRQFENFKLQANECLEEYIHDNTNY